jgi:deazaflavin-dependent oxidoreductase (nitroreductase family)
MSTTTTTTSDRPRQRIPAWVIRSIWKLHRALYRVSAGRVGLWKASTSQWGTLRLKTVGRKSGRDRIAIVGFIDDGPNLVTPAMNGWLEPEPAWWLNLQASPDAIVELPDGSRRAVTARRAIGEERGRLWQRLIDLGTSAFTDANAEKRSVETAIVVFEPRVP